MRSHSGSRAYGSDHANPLWQRIRSRSVCLYVQRPDRVIGNDMRNSFELALDHLGRKIADCRWR